MGASALVGAAQRRRTHDEFVTNYVETVHPKERPIRFPEPPQLAYPSDVVHMTHDDFANAVREAVAAGIQFERDRRRANVKGRRLCAIRRSGQWPSP